VNLIGPTAVFRERLEAADKRLLADGNRSEANTVEVLKKAGYDQRKLHRFDEDIFRDCRMLASFFQTTDTDSTNIEGMVTNIEKNYERLCFSSKVIFKLSVKCRFVSTYIMSNKSMYT